MTAKSKINWDEQPLGEDPDIVLAQKLGVNRGLVCAARLDRGIPHSGAVTRESYENAKIGLVPDWQVAARLSIEECQVKHYRTRHNIPSVRAKTKEVKKTINWDEQPLGKISDESLGKRLGVCAHYVSEARRIRGITSSRRHDWDSVDLGVRSDAQIAKEIGGTRSRVGQVRRERGIPPFDPLAINWEEQRLGLVPDTEIARALRVSNRTVGNHRRRLGIPAYKRTSSIDWDKQPLGVEMDYILARRLRTSTKVVKRARLERARDELRDERYGK